MKIKNYYVMNRINLDSLLSLAKQEFPIAIAFLLKRIMKVLSEMEDEIQNSRNDLIKKYGTSSKELIDGQEVEVINVAKSKPEQIQSFEKELNDLGELEFEIPIEKKIVLDLNQKVFEKLTLSPEQVSRLETIFDFQYSEAPNTEVLA